MEKRNRENRTHRETSRGKSRFTAAKSVECFTMTLVVKLPSWAGGGSVRTPRKTKLALPPFSAVSEEQAKGVAKSSCEMVAASASFSDCSSGGIFALYWEPQMETRQQGQKISCLITRESYLSRERRWRGAVKRPMPMRGVLSQTTRAQASSAVICRN